MALRIGALLATFLGSVVLARVLGPGGYGTYSFAFALATLLAVPVQMGVPALIVRETAKAHTLENWARIKGIWFWTTSRVAIASIVILTLGLLSVWLFRNRLGNETAGTIAIALGLIPLIALGNARGAALRGLSHVVKGQLPETVLRPAFLLLFVATGYWVLGWSISPAFAMTLHVLAAAIAFAIGVVLLLRARPSELAGTRETETDGPAWWSALWPFTLIAGLEVITQQTDLLMIGALLRPEDVGFYKIAVSAAALATFGLRVVGLTVGQQIVRHVTNKNKDELAQLAVWCVTISLAFTVPVVIIFGFWGTDILTLIYGAEYGAAYAPLVILIGAQVINAFFGVNLLLLNMSGFERDSLRGIMMSTGANVVLNAALIPIYGTNGAAVATLLSVTALNIYAWQFVVRRIGIDSSAFSIVRRMRSA